MIQRHKSCAEQRTADDVGEPMDTGNQSSDDHEGGKYNQRERHNTPECAVPDPAVKLHDSRWHYAQNQHGG
jgi:hypothetical protein